MDPLTESIPSPNPSPGTLGEVLYAQPKALVPEAEWVALVHCVAAGNQDALFALYERAHRVVFTLIMRIIAHRDTAEEVTLDVFHDVWRRASAYDEAGGTVLGWIMMQARSRAIDRMRFDLRQKRTPGASGDAAPMAGLASPEALVAGKQQGEALRRALELLTPDERTAIETAFFAELSYAETAVRLDQPLGTIKTRIRSGLHKLRLALGGEGRKS